MQRILRLQGEIYEFFFIGDITKLANIAGGISILTHMIIRSGTFYEPVTIVRFKLEVEIGGGEMG
jgi:hypothetical protein